MAQKYVQDSQRDKTLLEPFYKDADRKFQYIAIICGVTGIVLGMLFGYRIYPVLAMSIWVGLVFLAQRIPRRSFSMAAMGVLMTLCIALFITFCNGLVETRFLYLVGTLVLLYYRNRITQIAAAVTGAVFIAGMYVTLKSPDWALGPFFLDYILEPAGMVAHRIHITAFILVINAVAAIWLANQFEGRTREASILDRKQEQQIEILEHNRQLAEKIADGDLEKQEDIAEDDALGLALERMRQNLVDAHDREKQERFINEGIKKGDEVLRHQETGLESLCDEILQFLVEYLAANQGAIFLSEVDEEEKVYLDMYACYAYDRKKYLRQRIRPGQGLSGQVFLEGKTSYLKKIPGHYIQIRSGLGGANPRNLVMVPLHTSEGVKGVLELASFHEMEPYQIDFLEKIGANMAATFEVVRINDQTRALLEEARMAEAELRSKEEEMQQNMEELEATQEEMRRKERSFQKELESQKATHTIDLISLKRELAEARAALQELKNESQEESA